MFKLLKYAVKVEHQSFEWRIYKPLIMLVQEKVGYQVCRLCGYQVCWSCENCLSTCLFWNSAAVHLKTFFLCWFQVVALERLINLKCDDKFRHRDHDRDRERRHRHRTRSPSRGKSRHHSKSRSRSPSRRWIHLVNNWIMFHIVLFEFVLSCIHTVSYYCCSFYFGWKRLQYFIYSYFIYLYVGLHSSYI